MNIDTNTYTIQYTKLSLLIFLLLFAHTHISVDMTHYHYIEYFIITIDIAIESCVSMDDEKSPTPKINTYTIYKIYRKIMIYEYKG